MTCFNYCHQTLRRADRAKSEVWTIAVLMFISLASVSVAQTAPPTFEKRDDFQALIAQYAAADDDANRRQLLNRIRALDASPHHEAIRQSIAFVADATSTREAMGAAQLIRELKGSDQSLVESVMPLLDATDAKLVETADNILAGLEHRSAERRPDLSVYRELLADGIRNHEPRPDALIMHMYDADPGYAMLTLMRVHQLREPDAIKEILWAEHVVSDAQWRQRYGFLPEDESDPQAVNQLAGLARHDAWWARMYVAAVMRQNASLRSDTDIQMLQQDADPLVRQEALSK